MAVELDERIRRLKPGFDAIPPIERSLSDGVLTETRRFRGLTFKRAIGYLENLGGRQVDAGIVEAENWRATLSTRTVPVGPSYRLTEVEITWTGDVDVLEPVILHFRLKAFRAPG